MLNPLHFSILFSLFQGIWGDFGNNKEQRKIASGPQLENNFGETRDISERQENRNGTSEMILQRKTRDSLASEVYDGLRCLSCYANNGTSSLYDSCYNGLMAPLVNCISDQVCYTEFHPLYVKRGCINPAKVNLTFYCKCPMCNDKPAYDPVYYNYLNMRDWEYDNARLQKQTTIEQMIKIHGLW
ncbi:uncharacterized protein [Choristoneura fumiferana]|uniref:uncharacterized protein n=1 Tax=Choristoneura fumiferana TaxID=7141 RepID=UPI003D159565